MARARVGTLFDVIVVGGGHAGVEAAMSASRAGARVALITSSAETIGHMSCNPAIGGIAKGTVVREIDALGGVMGRATDSATIQFRMLNRGKGPAVWAPRSQCDRAVYRRVVRTIISQQHGVSVIVGTVGRLILASDTSRAEGVETLDGERLTAGSVVISTGTFLRGRIHIGVDTQLSGGRAGEAATTHLATQLADIGLVVGRFKTGTPPRIDGQTVDYSVMERQESELEDFEYSWSALSDQTNRLRQLPCWITTSGSRTKQVVTDHIAESAMYGGSISARGPRYCPSIEDKIVRFPDAESHQVYLEPEGLDTSELYVNGLSTSLPAPVQLEMLRSVAGLEAVEMTSPGYAIEYDYYPPTQLHPWLEVRTIAGLFFAGQINGTTGYEEAGAQGVVAGLNAAHRALDREPVVFGRETSYIGVLVDDIVTRGADEPYRLFTSRSEFRLTIRQDNALRRLATLGVALNLYSPSERRRIGDRIESEDRATEFAHETVAQPHQVAELLVASGSAPLQRGMKVADLVRRQGVQLTDLFAATGVTVPLTRDVTTTVELELKYAGYFAKERLAAERLRRMGEFALPEDAPYEMMRTLSIESRQKLALRRPLSLAQASSIPGVSPADLQNLVLEVERLRSRGRRSLHS